MMNYNILHHGLRAVLEEIFFEFIETSNPGKFDNKFDNKYGLRTVLENKLL